MMKLGDRIKQLRDELGLTQGQLAHGSSVSQGYLSQLENGEVKNPSAAVLLRVAQAMRIDPDELFEAAGYPTVRTLRQIYQDYESTVDAQLLRYLATLPRDRQRRLLLILQGMEQVINGAAEASNGPDWATPDDNAASAPLTLRRSPPATVAKGRPELTRARR
jgi:transcriptional regulator with XRE-family HTH domain